MAKQATLTSDRPYSTCQSHVHCHFHVQIVYCRNDVSRIGIKLICIYFTSNAKWTRLTCKNSQLFWHPKMRTHITLCETHHLRQAMNSLTFHCGLYFLSSRKNESVGFSDRVSFRWWRGPRAKRVACWLSYRNAEQASICIRRRGRSILHLIPGRWLRSCLPHQGFQRRCGSMREGCWDWDAIRAHISMAQLSSTSSWLDFQGLVFKN